MSVIEGSVLDVVVDIRRGSPTFGQYFSQELNTENRFQIFIPRGFAHGFITLSQKSIFYYKVDNFFNSKYERNLSPEDPELDINWRLSKDEWIQSKKIKIILNWQIYHYLILIKICMPSYLVTGAEGQLGKCLKKKLMSFQFIS